ncbi:MAG: hypothetical protein AB2535_14070 [Candidatus Thiodiazotropha endolucinida]
MNLIFKSLILIVLTTVILSGCIHNDKVIGKHFAEAFDCSEAGGWVVLGRPNSIWDIGTVLEINNYSVEDLGNIKPLNCFPQDKWVREEGESGSARFVREGRYEISLAATLGLTKEELINTGISLSGDLGAEAKSQHSVLFDTTSPIEERINYLLLEGVVEDNYNAMSSDCKRAITPKDRFLVDGVLKVVEGAFTVVNNNGATVDLSTPEFHVIQEAAIRAGFDVTKAGSIAIGKEQEPMTVCVRARRFERALTNLGINSKDTPKPISFVEAMSEASWTAK